MSKRKSIVIITMLAIFIIVSALLILPLNGQESIQIGKTNYDYTWISKSIKLGLDLEGGMYAIYQADLKGIEDVDAAMAGTISNLETLLFGKGYTEAIVTRQGTSEIRVEVPAIKDTEELMSLIGKPSELVFKTEDGTSVLFGKKHIKNAVAQPYEGSYAVALEFNTEGRKVFSEVTSANIGKKISINIDGKEIIAPTVNAAITDGKAVITGNYTYEQANELAVKIRSGALEVPLTLYQSETISPSLGTDALKYGIIAGLIGLIFIFFIMGIVYKGLGLFASIALVIYTELLFIFLAIVPWVQLTLPGIAGIILSIGMAVDANVVIFERIKDEKRNSNKSIPSAVKSGFKKAVTAILDANITTIFGSIVMIIFGATAIQSFAVTLLIGVILSMFTSIFVTRWIVKIGLSFNDSNLSFYGLKDRVSKNDTEEVAIDG